MTHPLVTVAKSAVTNRKTCLNDTETDKPPNINPLQINVILTDPFPNRQRRLQSRIIPSQPRPWNRFIFLPVFIFSSVLIMIFRFVHIWTAFFVDSWIGEEPHHRTTECVLRKQVNTLRYERDEKEDVRCWRIGKCRSS